MQVLANAALFPLADSQDFLFQLLALGDVLKVPSSLATLLSAPSTGSAMLWTCRIELSGRTIRYSRSWRVPSCGSFSAFANAPLILG
jgi:hypothetical protein